MTSAATADRLAVVGYDGSPGAARAIETGALLLPGMEAHVVHLWTPPFTDTDLRHRLWQRAETLDDLTALIEREGAGAAARLAADGAALAAAAGWKAQPLVHRSYGGEGLELARVAAERGAAVLVVGSRGLSGVRAALGSVSDAVAHYSAVPALVVPHPLLEEERRAAATGPVLIGDDGSSGARRAREAAKSLFPGREVAAAAVGTEASEQAPAAAAERVVLDPEGVAQSGRAVAGALARHAEVLGAAVIVVGSRGQSVAREILLGSVAMAVLHHSGRPVLVAPSRRFEA